MEAGLNPGDRLAVWVESSPEVLAFYAACARAGIVFLPLKTAYTTDELAYFVENREAAQLVADSSKSDGLSTVVRRFGAKLLTVDADGTRSSMEAACGPPEQFDAVSRSEEDLAAFHYTSGKTGRLKAAMFTLENLLSNEATLTGRWRFNKDDVLLHALLVFHTYDLFVGTGIPLLVGGRSFFCLGSTSTT